MQPLEKSDAATGSQIVEPDAHGQAALLLTESLIHSLVERNLLTSLEAIEVIESAAEVKLEVASAAGESKKRMQESLVLLNKMAASLATDHGHYGSVGSTRTGFSANAKKARID